MSLLKSWSRATKVLGGTKPKRLSYYLKHIRELVEGGFKMATPEMATEYDKLWYRHNDCFPWVEDRKSTYPSIRKTKPTLGMFHYGTHDRSEGIYDAITSLVGIHKVDIEAGKAWLMPVFDDEEYVSWEFDIVVGTEAEVLALVKAVVAKAMVDKEKLLATS